MPTFIPARPTFIPARPTFFPARPTFIPAHPTSFPAGPNFIPAHPTLSLIALLLSLLVLLYSLLAVLLTLLALLVSLFALLLSLLISCCLSMQVGNLKGGGTWGNVPRPPPPIRDPKCSQLAPFLTYQRNIGRFTALALIISKVAPPPFQNPGYAPALTHLKHIKIRSNKIDTKAII